MKTKRDKNNVDFIKDGYTNEELMEKITEIREKYVLNENTVNRKVRFLKSWFNPQGPLRLVLDP